MDFKTVLLVFACTFGIAVGQFRCYSCGFSSSDSDRSCLTVTNDTRVVNCPFKYCTILRQEYLDPVGVVVSFTRGCEQMPDFLNHEVTDSTFRTFYRACTHDICNTGNGIDLIGGGNLVARPPYSGENILVPGTRNQATLVKTSLLTLIISVYISCYF